MLLLCLASKTTVGYQLAYLFNICVEQTARCQNRCASTLPGKRSSGLSSLCVSRKCIKGHGPATVIVFWDTVLKCACSETSCTVIAYPHDYEKCLGTLAVYSVETQ